MKNSDLVDPMDRLEDYRLTPSNSPTIAEQIRSKLHEYGSTEQWPTLRIEPNAFSTCVCGHKRSTHKIGVESSPCATKGKCDCTQFTWAGGVKAKRS